MTTLNARANQAWNEIEPVKNDWDPTPFYSQQDAFEEGWETGYKAKAAELAWWITTGPTDDKTARRIAGPFASQNEAMENRVTIEQYTTPVTFWIVEDPS